MDLCARILLAETGFVCEDFALPTGNVAEANCKAKIKSIYVVRMHKERKHAIEGIQRLYDFLRGIYECWSYYVHSEPMCWKQNKTVVYSFEFFRPMY